jgi:hypothetical protein
MMRCGSSSSRSYGIIVIKGIVWEHRTTKINISVTKNVCLGG